MGDEEPRFELIWSESAIADLEAVCAFIAVDNPSAAERIGQTILEHVELLARFPFIGSAFPLGSRGPVRELVVRRTYRLFYSVDEFKREIDVLRVWHGARGQPELPTS